MIKIIIKKFINDYTNIEDKKVRENYSITGGVLGIICNLFLFGLKLTIGLVMNSIAITSDAFNNLSDTGSSLIAIIGAKMSNRLPDKEHPFGHGRIEYISSLIVSFIIIIVGFELFKSSLGKVFNPEEVVFNSKLMIILSISILIKIWMFSYNNYISRVINSSVNKATAFDSLNDAVATSAVIVSTIIGKFLNFSVDGIAGLIVSLLIMYTGIKVAKDVVNVLLGESPSEELVNDISTLVMSSDYIVGIHSLQVHDYGPGRTVASVHAEVIDDLNMIEAHSIIDEIEKNILEQLKIDIVIHVDPIARGE